MLARPRTGTTVLISVVSAFALAGYAWLAMVSRPRQRAAAARAAPALPSPVTPPAAPAAATEATDDIQPGRTFELTVSDKDRDEPERNGIARLQGVVILVPDSRPGDRVRVIIRERRRRFARSEVLERLAPK